VLDFLHGLLHHPVPPSRSLEKCLRELAEAFAVPGAGMANASGSACRVLHRVRTDESVSQVLPLELTPQILAELHAEPRIRTVATGVGNPFLVTGVPDGGLLWLEEDKPRTWTEAEKGALVLAGQVLASLYPMGNGASLEAARLLAGRMAHSMGNVLTGIMGYAELAAMQVVPGSPTSRYTAEILHAANLGVLLVNQLQQLNAAGKHFPGNTYLEMVLDEVRQQLQPPFQKGAALQVDMPADLPLLAIARQPLQVLLRHLLNNACEAAGPTGRVVVLARPVTTDAGQGIEICITDTGPGLSSEVLERISRFLFFSTKPRHHGLGLAIVREIVRAHHGRFELGPHSPEGALARLWLPEALPSPPPSLGIEGSHEPERK
jgi:signal transduction histidine kinase